MVRLVGGCPVFLIGDVPKPCSHYTWVGPVNQFITFLLIPLPLFIYSFIHSFIQFIQFIQCIHTFSLSSSKVPSIILMLCSSKTFDDMWFTKLWPECGAEFLPSDIFWFTSPPHKREMSVIKGERKMVEIQCGEMCPFLDFHLQRFCCLGSSRLWTSSTPSPDRPTSPPMSTHHWCACSWI